MTTQPAVTQPAVTQPAVIDPPNSGSSPAWWFLDTLVVEHATASGDSPVVLEMTLPVGAAPPLHVHMRADDSWYLLDGLVVVRCGDDLTVAEAGHWVSLPRGVPHGFRVVGDRPARMLGVHADLSFPEFVRDIGDPAGALRLPEPTGGPGIDDLRRSMEAHDVIVVGESMTPEEAQAVLAARR